MQVDLVWVFVAGGAGIVLGVLGTIGVAALLFFGDR